MARPLDIGLKPLPYFKWGDDRDIVCIHDLPKPGTFRWTPARRLLFIEAVKHKLLTAETFLQTYGVSLEQLVAGGELPEPVLELQPVLQPTQIGPVITVGLITVDLVEHTTWVKKGKISLQPRQQALMEYFARHAGQVVTRHQLLDHIATKDTDPKSIDVHMTKIRQALGAAADHLHTVWGVGYELRKPDEN